MTPERRAALLALAAELDSSPYESAAAYADRVRELAEPERDVAHRGTLETHLCAWTYTPRQSADKGEVPRWRCVKRWHDGQACKSEVDNPDTVVRAAYPPAPRPR